MSGCCLYCIHAQAFWIGPDGKKHLPPKQSFGDMNIYCHHPDKGATVFEQAGDEQIQRRRDFFSQFERWSSHAQIIAQRNSNVLETASNNSTKQQKSIRRDK